MVSVSECQCAELTCEMPLAGAHFNRAGRLGKFTEQKYPHHDAAQNLRSAHQCPQFPPLLQTRSGTLCNNHALRALKTADPPALFSLSQEHSPFPLTLLADSHCMVKVGNWSWSFGGNTTLHQPDNARSVRASLPCVSQVASVMTRTTPEGRGHASLMYRLTHPTTQTFVLPQSVRKRS